MITKKYKIRVKNLDIKEPKVSTNVKLKTNNINKQIKIDINLNVVISNFKPDTYVEVPFDCFFVMAFYTYIDGTHYNASWGLLNDCGLALRSKSGNTRYNNGAYPLSYYIKSWFEGPLIMSLSVTKGDAVAFSNWGWSTHSYYGNHMYTYGKLFVSGWPIFTRRNKLMFGDKLIQLKPGFLAEYGGSHMEMPNIKFI